MSAAATSYSSTGVFTLHSDTAHTLFSASGANSLLDLSEVTSINARVDDSRADKYTRHYITAGSGGRIDLSKVSSITGPVHSDDRLYIQMSGGGEVDLSMLAQTTGGNVQFNIADVPGGTYSLPALISVKDTSFYPGTGMTLNLPALTTYLSGATNVPSAGSLSAPALTSYSGSLTVGENADANLPLLDTFSNGTLTIEQNGTVDAPSLTNFLGASLTLGPLQTLNAPGFEDIDNSKLAVTGGAQLSAAATSYSSTGVLTVHVSTTHTLFSASDANSLLDLSGVTSINAGFNDQRTDRYTYHYITAGSGGRIDLSKVSSIAGPVQSDDKLLITADGNSQIDLSSLQTVSSGGEVRFTVGGQSGMLFGDLTVSTNMKIFLTDVRSQLDVGGSLLLDSTSSLSAVGGSHLSVGEDLTFGYTSESLLNLDAAIVEFDGMGLQNLEIGGADNGLPDPNEIVTGNFAMGQLIVGQDALATTLQLLEEINNGNRGLDDAPEALYLNGLGGPDGLILRGGSTLILDNLNVYTTENNVWVHLNDQFGPGQTVIPYSGGWLELPEPATLTLLAMGGLVLLRRRRR